jgi:hypothetical protein
MRHVTLARPSTRPFNRSVKELGGPGIPFKTTRLQWKGNTMAAVVFSSEIQHYVSCPPRTVFGQTVREILESYFEGNRAARSYILDERGCLRPKLGVLIDGVPAQDRLRLSDSVHLQAKVFVLCQLLCHEGD